jgi:hypothetical protein
MHSENMMTRRCFALGAVAFATGGCLSAASEDSSGAGEPGIRVRFLGSGAAGWDPKWLEAKPHARRPSSALFDGRVLIDFTQTGFDMLPDGCRPEVLFQTHSHGDHYNPTAAVKSGVRRVYVQESWASAAREEIAAAAKRLSLPSPEVIGLPFAKAVYECGLRFTGVPANHSTSRVTDGTLERPSLYLVEKGATRLLYATDTGGIPGDAARMIGIDPHIKKENYDRFAKSGSFVAEPKPLTAIIMESTNGDSDADFRMFVHSSVQTVARTVDMLRKNGRYTPPSGQCAYITHIGLKYRNWPSDKIDAKLPAGMRAAYDGFETTFL